MGRNRSRHDVVGPWEWFHPYSCKFPLQNQEKFKLDNFQIYKSVEVEPDLITMCFLVGLWCKELDILLLKTSTVVLKIAYHIVQLIAILDMLFVGEIFVTGWPNMIIKAWLQIIWLIFAWHQVPFQLASAISNHSNMHANHSHVGSCGWLGQPSQWETWVITLGSRNWGTPWG